MINRIIDAIAASIFEEFGDGYTIYDENVEQGLKEPCFFITCVNPTNDLFIGKRYFRRNQFCIDYIPATDNRKRECNAVADRLYSCLERIWIDKVDSTRGTKMNYEVVDGVLHFFVNYNMFVYKIVENAPMEDLKHTTDVKG